MGTLNTAWNIATGALAADQSALNVVANNTSNANTPGYTREAAIWQENDPVHLSGLSYGMGVSFTGSVSQRDRVLEQRLQQQTQVTAAGSARLAALNNVEGIFSQSGSSASSSGIASAISGFYNSMAQLESGPSDTSLRQQVLSAANTLAQSIQNAAASLGQQRSSLDNQASSLLSQVNSLSQSIASLNRQIESGSPSTDAGVLEDQRQQDLLQLSQLIGIHTIPTEGNGLTVTTTSGAVLVAKDVAVPLTASSSGGVTHFYSGTTDITSQLVAGGGQLGGMLAVRDLDIPNLQSSLDQLAYGIATKINSMNSGGYDATGAAGGNIFAPPAAVTGAALNMSVVLTDPSGIAAATSSGAATDNSNAINMADPMNSTIAPGQTATSFYSSFVTVFGSNVAASSTQNTAQQASLTQLQNQRNALSTVDLNEEAAAMSNLERSFQAASKVFSILNSVMASALNLGEQSTVS
ncbi:MAG TPA: flagellar hook-associated protein FlgK [Acidisarcina sp.]|nr:flagellar hook-associated protein FlgK [Acidisarcina sp.]